jgi:hypothetical protein
LLDEKLAATDQLVGPGNAASVSIEQCGGARCGGSVEREDHRAE